MELQSDFTKDLNDQERSFLSCSINFGAQSAKMFQKSLASPFAAPIPIGSLKPWSKSSRNLNVVVRSEAVDASNRADPKPNPAPSKLFESSSSAAAAGPYPGGMGLHTGRDPTVRKPEWLRQRAPHGEKYARLQESLAELKLNTVCVEAQCPNIGEVQVLEIQSVHFVLKYVEIVISKIIQPSTCMK